MDTPDAPSPVSISTPFAQEAPTPTIADVSTAATILHCFQRQEASGLRWVNPLFLKSERYKAFVPTWRGILVRYLADLAAARGMSPRTVCHGMLLLDRAMAAKDMHQDTVQVHAVVCLLIASKLHQPTDSRMTHHVREHSYVCERVLS